MSQAPTLDQLAAIHDTELWQQFNGIVDELTNLSGEDYRRFKIPPQNDGYGQQFIAVDGYRAKLGGLISRLHGKYFADEQPPFSGMPQTVNILTQQQSQAVHIHMILELTEQLTRSEAKSTEGSKERGFIDKAKGLLKSTVTGTTNMAQLILLILNIASQCGLSVADVQKIFGG